VCRDSCGGDIAFRSTTWVSKYASNGVLEGSSTGNMTCVDCAARCDNTWW
jgi:hypothetical protein